MMSVWLYSCLVGVISMSYVLPATIDSCNSEIYCKGELLHTVQYTVKVYKDSKSFVDLSQIYSPNVTLTNFKTLMAKTKNSPSLNDMVQFLNQNFVDGSEIEEWTPPDFINNPSFLNNIPDWTTRNFAKKLVSIWPKLARKVKNKVFQHPEQFSLIPVPNGFVIPGGRFKEIYYWDSYWIIKGLIISEMTQTAKGMIENMLSLVSRFGFVPNGSRVYYLNRSQPPLLALMVKLYIDATNDIDWLRKNIGILERELNWWQTNRSVDVVKNGVTYNLVRYAVESNTPRPESYFEDVKTCINFAAVGDKEACYRNLKSGAESGWDFSSRWIIDSNNSSKASLSLINTRQIVPVDLNSLFCRANKEVARFYDMLGNEKESAVWWEKAQTLEKSIDAVLYDKVDGIWYDYDLKNQSPRKSFYPSNFAPLWAESYNAFFKKGYGARAANYFVKKIDENKFIGGIPTSLIESGEQWDLPNSWPPLQEIIILGLYSTEDKQAQKVALDYARTWIESNELGFAKTGDMFEKYDSFVPGQYGGGGEYTVQSGFGWTNGVVLSLLDKFPNIMSGNASQIIDSPPS